jgi:GT2 family glycosyltransferase
MPNSRNLEAHKNAPPESTKASGRRRIKMDPTTPHPSNGRTAVVIATHKYCYPLEECISSHLKLLQYPEDLIFVDNGSGGEMTRWAQERFPDITVVTQQKNGFFCGGYNAGMRDAIERNYEYVLIVNADTSVYDDSYLNQLRAVADSNPRSAFLGPRVYIREPGNVQNTILCYPWFGRYLWQWLTARFRNNNRSAAAGKVTSVDFLNGVCVLCRVAALREVGLLDEDMGGYVEDTDWSWRARQLGWASLFVPTPSIIHHQPSDEYEHFSVKTFMLRRNHVYWHMKAGHRIQAHLFAVFSLWLAIARTTVAVLRGRNAPEHRRYLRRFQSVSRKILRGKSMGDWFGPPIGQL